MAAGGGLSKKKQEEETLRALREIASVTSNKQCFDCGQKGPTYLNMTIGCFVCTACSGLLRGLNPPQRVKSVSMASFTPEEIEFIKSRGNDFCRKVWLGQSSDAPPIYAPGSRDEMKIRDTMALRYEKKKWYVAPTDAMHEEARKINSSAAAANKPKQPIIGKNNTLLISATTVQLASRGSPTTEPKPVVSAPSQSNPVSPTSTLSAPAAVQTGGGVKSFDLLADLGGDPFAQQPSVQHQPQQQQQPVENGMPNFANFGNFSSTPNFFSQPASTVNNTGFFPAAQPVNSTSQWSTLSSGPAPPVQSQTTNFSSMTSAEKYSAIAEIDGVFSQQNAGPLTGGAGHLSGGGGPLTGGSMTVNWNNNPSSQSTMFGGGMSSHSATTTQSSSVNPFGASMPVSQPASVNPFMQSSAPQPAMFAQPGGYMPAGGFTSQPAPFSQPAAFPSQPPTYMQATGAGFQQGVPPSFQPAGVSGFPAGFGPPAGRGGFGADGGQMFGAPGGGAPGGAMFYNPAQASSANPFMSSAPKSINTSNPFL